MIQIVDPKECCGCSACASICPTDAISMEPDALGFLFPIGDAEKCIQCGLCEKVCAFNDNYDTSLNLEIPIAYAVRHKSMKEIESSRSGGAFIAISDYVLRQGGVVYGAGYTDHFRVVHKRAETKEQRNEFKGSKYTQSDMGTVFRQVKDDLKAGYTVLFSGTPCQTSGLNSFIGEKWKSNLILIDIVCHGVPSPYIWRDYLKYLEKKHHTVFTSVNFRDKKYGWAAHKETFYTDGKYITSEVFRELFYNHIDLRHSCSVCHFTNLRRPSDISLADFWGWEKTDPNFNADDKGCSLVILNTEKAQKIFNEIREDINSIAANIDNILQPALVKPYPAHPQREQFESDYVRLGFKYILFKYGSVGWYYRLKKIKQQAHNYLMSIKNKI